MKGNQVEAAFVALWLRLAIGILECWKLGKCLHSSPHYSIIPFGELS